jgi:hypothetical protein
MKRLAWSLAVGLLLSTASARSGAGDREGPVWLVTEGEAMLPAPPAARSPASLPKDGPVIKVQAPQLTADVSPPFAVDVVFEPRASGAPPKMDSLKVTYLKVIEVDVTDRFKPYLKDNRLFVEKANVPQGRHRLKISIADLEGRTTAEVLQVTVR